MIDPTEEDIGRKAIYRPRGQSEVAEEGVVTSIRGRFVFVRYGNDPGSKATKAEDPHWANPRQAPGGK